MSLLDLHADDLAGAARNTAYIPPAPKPAEGPKFNGWKATTAPLRGARSGAQESVGFWADVIGAFGQVAGAYPEVLGVVDLTPEQRRQADEQRVKLLTEGIDYSSPAGDLFRDVARSSAPDPQTAHVAENLLYQFPRFATKAVGYGATTGPVVGSILTGADEAMAASDELKRQGVDLSTRTQAAAVQGVGAGLSVALPMAGKTVAQTVGLIAAGGPGTFIAQQAATREILRAADYSKIADQYDPLDPVGLAVATLVPAGFGAYGLLRARVQAKADAAATAAAAEREFIAGPLPSERTAVAQAVDAYRPTPEQFDAALVTHQQEVREAHALTPREDFAGFARHEEAIAKAEDQMARGEPVRVADVVEPTRVDPLIEFASRVRDEMSAVGPDPWEIPSSRPLVESLPPAAAVADDLRSMGRMAFWAQEGGRLLRDGNTDAPGTGGMGNVAGRTGWIPAEEWFGRMRSELGRAGLASRDDIEAAIEKAIRGEPLRAAEQRTVDWIRQEVAEMQSAYRAAEFAPSDAGDLTRDTLDAGLSKTDTADAAKVARAAETDPDAVERAAVRFENDDAAFMAEVQRIVDGQATKQGSGADAGRAQAGEAGKGPSAEPTTSDAAAASPEEVAAATARLAEIQAQFPDLEVMLDGMDKPQKLSDFLASVQREADEMRSDAQDFEVAANCFLTMGG